MTTFNVALNWNRDSSEFTHASFNRSHQIKFSCGIQLEASSAPEYLGDPGKANPEEIFLASISSCHMLTFLAIAAKSRYVVDSYQDSPEAILEKNEAGMSVISRVQLKPKVAFSGEKVPDEAKIRLLHEKAHKYCFIANSVKSEVVWDPQF